MTPRLAPADTSARIDRTWDAPKTRWPRLWSLLTGQPILTEAQHAYEQARKDAIRAELANDDRALGQARMRMTAAQCQRLREGS